MTPVLTVDPGATREVRRHGSAATLVVHDCSDPDAALAALHLAEGDIWAIPHPDEPGSGLPNSVRIGTGPDGPQVYLDVKDEGPAFAGQIVDLVAGRLREAGVGGLLRGHHAGDDDEDAPPLTTTDGPHWQVGRPGAPWPADLELLGGGPPEMVVGMSAGGPRWLLAHWQAHDVDVVARLTSDGWTVRTGTAAEQADPERSGPFSDPRMREDPTGSLRLRHAERAGRTVVVGVVDASGIRLVRAALPLAEVVDSPAGTAAAWPAGFPPDLPPIADAVQPPAAVIAPGLDGASWHQVRWLRRTPGHASDFADALVASGWSLTRADDLARTTMEAAARGRRGGLGSDDVRGWSASRREQRLFVISLPLPGTGALLVVSTPAG